jgi:hypothetical protein
MTAGAPQVTGLLHSQPEYRPVAAKLVVVCRKSDITLINCDSLAGNDSSG